VAHSGSSKEALDREAARKESFANFPGQFARAFSFSPVGTVIRGMNGDFVWANDTACRMLGYSREEFAGISLADLLPRHGAEELRQDAALLASGEADGRSFIRFYAHKDGHEIGTRAHISCVRNAEGKPDYLIAQFEVIDDDGDRAVFALSRRLDFDLELTGLVSDLVTLPVAELDVGINRILGVVGKFVGAEHCGIFEYDADRDVFERTHGWGRDDIAGELAPHEGIPGDIGRWSVETVSDGRPLNIYDIDDSDQLPEVHRDFLVSRGVSSLVVLPLDASISGSRYASFVAATPQRWDEQSIAIFSIATQIVANALERKHVVSAQSETNELVRSVAAGVIQGIWVWSPGPARVLYGNSALLDLYELDDDHGAAPTDAAIWAERVHPDDRDAVSAHLYDGLEQVGELEYRLSLPDGRERWLHSRAFPVAQGLVITPRVVGVTEDITERKYAERQAGRRAQFDQLITDIATGFVGISADALDGEIEVALERLAGVAGVEWGMIEVVELDGNSYVTHEWHAPGAHCFKTLRAAGSTNQLSWFVQAIGANNVIEMCDVGSLPVEAAEEREGLELLGVGCGVHVPLETTGGANCALALLGRSPRPAHEVAEWVPLLTVAAQTFAAAFEAARVDAEREKRGRQQALIASLAVDFASVLVDDLEAGIVSGLGTLARFVGVPRSAIVLFGETMEDVPSVYEWHGAELLVHKSLAESIPQSSYPWSMEELTQRRNVVVDDVTMLPAAAASDRRMFEEIGLSALIDIPLISDNVVIGFLTLMAESGPFHWSKDSEALLTITAEMFSNAIVRAQLHHERQSLANRTRLILETVAEGIYGLDKDGNTTFVNGAAAKMLGWESGQLIGKQLHSLIHHTRADGSPYPASECPMYAAASTSTPQNSGDDEVFWRRDGNSFPVEFVVSPILDEGISDGSVVVFRDISDRKSAEAARSEHTVLERIVTKLATDFINLPTVRLDRGIEDALAEFGRGAGADFALLVLMRRGEAEFNTAIQWSADSGVSRSELSLSGEGWAANSLLDGRSIEVADASEIPTEAVMERAWAESLGIESYAAVPIDGARGPLGVLALASKKRGRRWLLTAGGLFTITADMFANVVERIGSEEESEAHQSALAHALRMGTIGELAAGIAHEINQPLSAISNFARGINNNLRDARVDIPDLMQANEKIADLAVRAGEIIKRVRGHVRKEPAQRSNCDLSDLVDETAALVRAELVQHRVELEIVLNPIIEVYVDPIQIQQVMLNLIRNAIDAMELRAITSRIVTMSWRDAGDGTAEVLVADTAGGVDPKAVGEMFHQFYTTKEGGLGLGLSISKSIVEAHGGHLELVRDDEEGATFSFTVPLRRP